MSASVALKESAPAVGFPVFASRSAALACAREFAPKLRERASHAEEIRRIPEDTIAELRACGLLGILTPKRFGGSELGIATLVETTAELARGCVSSGWVFGNLLGHYWLLSQFPLVAQEAVYAKPGALVSTIFRFGGKAPVRVEGGYRIQAGEGKWASGVDHAEWVILGTTPAGEEPTYMLVPRKDFEIVDDWHTSGMRGTGSKSIRITDAHVPDARVIRLADVVAGSTPGGAALGIPLFSLPMGVALPLSLVGAPVGAALGAIQVFGSANAARLKALAEPELSAQSATFARVGEAAAMVDAALALIFARCRTRGRHAQQRRCRCPLPAAGTARPGLRRADLPPRREQPDRSQRWQHDLQHVRDPAHLARHQRRLRARRVQLGRDDDSRRQVRAGPASQLIQPICKVAASSLPRPLVVLASCSDSQTPNPSSGIL